MTEEHPAEGGRIHVGTSVELRKRGTKNLNPGINLPCRESKNTHGPLCRFRSEDCSI
jgi:hypothetical protein